MAQFPGSVRPRAGAYLLSRVRGLPAGSPRLAGAGVLLLVGALIAALAALALPASPRAAAAPAAVPVLAASSPVPRTPKSPLAHKTTPVAPSPARIAPTRKPVAVPVEQVTTAIRLRAGDTLWALAHRYATSVAELQQLNGLGDSSVIYAGRSLRVPSAAAPAHHASTVAPAAAKPLPVGRAAVVIAYARAQLGKPYAWGGVGPAGFDCSGLVQRAWQGAGVGLPRTSYEQAGAGRIVTRTQLQPGDLVFTNGLGHVQLYLGGAKVIEAPHSGARVRIAPLPAADQVDRYVRVAEPAPQPATSHPAATGAHPATPAPTPTKATATSTAPSSSPRGIYAFSGANTSTLATDPDLAGRSLVYYWAQLEPKPGVYRWDLIDKDIAPWAAAGKKVILRVSTSGWASWDKAADSAHGTPAWVYSQGVEHVTETDGAVLPQYWNPAFLKDYAAFLTAFAARYDGNPHVALIDAAVGIGGETKPDSEKNPNLLALWQKIGYSDPLWWSAVQQILTAYTQAFHKTPVAVMPDKTFLAAAAGYNEAKTVAVAVSKGLWLQDNGLIPGRTLPTTWAGTTLVSEQRGPTAQTGDTLGADLHAALADHAALILVFTSDLTSANSAAIHQAAQQLRTVAPTTAGSTR